MLSVYRFVYIIASLSLLAIICIANGGVAMCASHYYIVLMSSVVISLLLPLPLFSLSSYLEICQLEYSNIKGVEAADATFVPMYFAYVFVGLSIQSLMSLLLCYALLVLISFCAQTYYFNPLYYLFGYKYYFVTNSVKHKLLIMSRRRIPLDTKINFNRLARINDFTYIDIEEENELSNSKD